MDTGKSTKETVKTIAQGMPVIGFTCGDYARVLFLNRTRGYGCWLKHLAFPAPSVFEGLSFNDPDAMRAAGMLERVNMLSRPILRDARRRRAPQDEVSICGAEASA